jgi:hypothetical protein
MAGYADPFDAEDLGSSSLRSHTISERKGSRHVPESDDVDKGSSPDRKSDIKRSLGHRSGLAALEEDLARGRREAPFANDPRPPGSPWGRTLTGSVLNFGVKFDRRPLAAHRARIPLRTHWPTTGTPSSSTPSNECGRLPAPLGAFGPHGIDDPHPRSGDQRDRVSSVRRCVEASSRVRVPR